MVPDRLTRFALAIIRRYPKAWRDRYEVELAGYVEDSVTGWRDVLDLARGCVVERARAWLVPEDHPHLAGALLWCLRMVPALVWTGAIFAAGAYLRRTFGEPATPLVAAAVIALVPLGIVGFRAWMKVFPSAWTDAGQPLAVPPRWAVATWIGLFSVSLVLVFGAGLSDNSPSRFGWVSHYLVRWVYIPLALRKAFDLYWPAGLCISGQLMRVAGIREQLSWARMELARCEGLAVRTADASGELSRAMADVRRLEGDLHAAIDALGKSPRQS